VKAPPPNTDAFQVWCRTLQLSPEDERKQAWLDRVAGASIGGHVSLSTSPGEVTSIMGKPDPEAYVRCTACGGTFALPEFVATFATEYSTKPRCAGCRS
jgi:hypothetical protein